MKKRLLSLVLCLVMVFSLFPSFAVPAMAADGDTEFISLGATRTWTGSEIAAWDGSGETYPSVDGELYYLYNGQYYVVHADKDEWLQPIYSDDTTRMPCTPTNFPAQGYYSSDSTHWYGCFNDMYVNVNDTPKKLFYDVEWRRTYQYYEYSPYYTTTNTANPSNSSQKTYMTSSGNFTDRESYGWWESNSEYNYFRKAIYIYTSSQNYNWIYFNDGTNDRDLFFDVWSGDDAEVQVELFYKADTNMEGKTWIYTPVDQQAWLTNTDYESYGDLFYFDGTDYHQVSTTPAEHLYQNAGTSWTLTNAPGKYYSMSPISFGAVRAGSGDLYTKVTSNPGFRDMNKSGNSNNSDSVELATNRFGIRTNYFYKVSDGNYARVYTLYYAHSLPVWDAYYEGHVLYYNANDGQEPTGQYVASSTESTTNPNGWKSVSSKFTDITEVTGNTDYNLNGVPYIRFVWAGVSSTNPTVKGTYYTKGTGNTHLEYNTGSGSYSQLPNSSRRYEDGTNPTLYTDVLYNQIGAGAESLYYTVDGTTYDLSTTDHNGRHSWIYEDTIYTGTLYTRQLGVTGDLTGYKSLEDNQNGTYKLNIDSWATGAAQGYTSETSGGGSGGDEIETIITEQVEQPLDIVLVIDQSGSMKTADMGSVTADSYQLVNHTGAWTEAELNDGTVYYVKDKSGNYHRLERETGNVFEEAGAVRGNKMFGYGHDGFSVFFNGAPVHFNVKTPYYIKGADGEMHRLFMVTAGLDLEYGLYPYIYNNNDDAYAQKSEWTWLDNFLWLALVAPWGVKRLQNNDDWAKIINKNGSDGISWVNTNGQPLSSSNSDGDSVKLVYRRAFGITITNASYIRNLYTVADQGVTGLYYTASDGTKVPVSNTRTMGDENFTISTDTTDGNLYVVHTSTTRVDALQYAANEFVKDIAENSTEHAKHRIAVVGFAGNKTPALSSGWTAYSTPRADGSFNGSTKYDYTNTGLFLPGANGTSSFVNYGTIGSYDKPSAIYSNVHYYINGTDDVKTPIVNRYNRWYNLETGTQTTATSSFLEPKHTWLSANQYQSALVTVKQDNDAKNYLNPVANGVNDSIDDIIANLGAYGGTYTSYGLAMANQIFANATENTGLKTTTTVVKVNGVEDPEQGSVVPETLPAKHVIVFFTDGEPGAYGFESAIANEALAGGVQSKMTSVSGADGYDATVYTVGLYPGSVSRQVENFMHQLSSEYTAQLQPVDATSDLAVKTTLDSSKTYYYQDETGKFYSATTFYNDESSLGWWRHNADGSYSPLTVVGRNGGGVDEIYSDQACTKQVDGEDADTSATYYNNGRPVRYEYRWYNSDRLVVEPELGTNESLPGASTRRYQFFEISGQTSNSDGAQYYYRASDVSSLNAAFESIANSIKTQATTTGGDASAVQPIVVTTKPVSYNGDNSQVIDYVSPAFEVPEGATVEVQIVESTGLNADSTFEAVNGKTYEKPFVGSATTVISATTDASADGTFDGKTIHMDRSGKTVKVTGFDFSKYYISSNHPGKFLRVVINGLEPNGTGELFSNTTKSGIYNKEAEPGMLFQYNNPSIEVKTFKVLWQNGEDVLETDSGLTYADQLSYDGETPSKPDETVDNGNNTKTVTTYQFVGWSTNENAAYNDDGAVLTPAEIAAGIPVTGDQTYYAIFKPEQTLVQSNYTVQWHSSNSVQNPIHTDTEVAAGTYPSNLTAVAAPNGQLFVGWTTDADYQPTYNDDGTVKTFPDNYFVTRTNLPVEYYDKDDGAEDGVVKFYAVFVNAGKLTVAPDRTVIAEYSVQSQIETGVYDFDGRSANGSFTKTLDGEANERGTLYFTFNGIAKSGSIASGYDLTPLSQVSKATYYTGAPADSNLDRTVTTVTVIPGSSVYLDDSLTTKTTGAADGNGIYNYTAALENANAGEGSTEQMAKNTQLRIRFTGTRIDLYCSTTEEGQVVNAWVVDKDGKIVKNGNASLLVSMKNQSAEPRYNVPTISFTMPNTADGKPGTYTLILNDYYGDYKLDGVRVYNSVAELDGTVEENAHYVKLRDKLVSGLAALLEKQDPIPAISFHMDVGEDLLSDYVKEGPKNEIYLDENEWVAFEIEDFDQYQGDPRVMVGLSVQHADDDATVQLNSNKTQHIKAVTDSYYTVNVSNSGADCGIVYIKNLSNVRVAITNLKITGVNGVEVHSTDNSGAYATVQSVNDEPAVQTEAFEPNLIVTRRLMSFMENPVFSEPPADPEPTPSADPEPSPSADPEPTPSADPEPDPTKTPTLQDLLQQLFSSFVQNLFKSISKLFGN